MLRLYSLSPDFKTASGSSGTVSATDYASGAAMAGSGAANRITLADPDRKLGFTIQADLTHDYGNAAKPLVDASIKSGRLLTGADLDIESMRQDKNGKLWFGDEFGPFLVKTEASGKVLRSEISLAGVKSPQNPYLGGGVANLGASGDFEGMVINSTKDKLYTLLEKTVTGDPAKSLRINEFSIDTESYTANSFRYALEAQGTAIGDMTAINDHEFLVIERNGGTATSALAPFKKIFRIDLNQVDGLGNVAKSEVVDLMNIADPHDLNGDGRSTFTFTFPFVTIEDVLILDERTLLVINDNKTPAPAGAARSRTTPSS